MTSKKTEELPLAVNLAAALVHVVEPDGAGGFDSRQAPAADLAGAHNHPIAAIDGLTDALASKADAAATAAALGGKADQAATNAALDNKTDEALLAGDTGASLVGFKAAGVGAVWRTLQSKERDVIHAKDYGVLADGVTDDKAALQLAVNAAAGSGEVRLPRGSILVSGAINMNGQAVTLRGEGPFATKLECSALGATVLNITGDHCAFAGLSIHYGGVPTAGAKAIAIDADHIIGTDFMIRNAYDGIAITSSSDVRLSSFAVLDYENTALWAYDTVLDLFVSQFYLNCGISTRGALGAIRLQNRVEAANFTDGEILQGVYSMTTAAAVNAAGSRPAYCKFAGVYFDSSQNGVLIDKMVETEFHDCWFSNRPNKGIVLNNCDGIKFLGGGALNCGTHGVLVNNTALRTVFDGFTARGNSQAGAGVSSGIVFAAGTTDFIVSNCILGGGPAIGFTNQAYGCLVNTGASDRYIVADNLVNGNATGGVFDGGTGVNKRVANNY